MMNDMDFSPIEILNKELTAIKLFSQTFFEVRELPKEEYEDLELTNGSFEVSFDSYKGYTIGFNLNNEIIVYSYINIPPKWDYPGHPGDCDIDEIPYNFKNIMERLKDIALNKVREDYNYYLEYNIYL